MKKLFFFCALLAGIAVMTGCQKDQDVVTLKAVIDQDTKAYFGGADANNNLVTPYWDDDEQVYVKGLTDFPTNSFPLTGQSTTVATVENVPASGVYCAIYPASAVLEMGTPSAGTDGTTAKITFKHDQEYKEDNNHVQLLEMPMGAVTTGNTLIFKNLCGILRVKVVNTSGNTFNVKRVSVISEDGTFIAGDGIVTLYKNGDPAISMSSHHTYTVDQAIQLHKSGYSSMGAITSSTSDDGSNSMTFDIIVPPFTTQALTFDVESVETGAGFGYFTQTVQGTISVARNDIAEVTLTINQFQANNHAYLIDGPAFNRLIKTLDGINGVTRIWFGNPVVGGLPTNDDEHVRVVNVEASYSPNPVYAYIDANDPTILHVNANIQTNDPVEFYANADCSDMYADLPNLWSILYNLHRFITEDVTDMSRMFAGCINLANVPGLGDYVTTNVETMAYMFDGCAALGDLDLESFSTQHLRPDGMVGMFRGCTSLSALDMQNFTTEQITTMESLFDGCANLTEINIVKFDMSNVNTLTNMCNHLNYSHHRLDEQGNFAYNQWNPMSNNPCRITCGDNTWNTLKGQADLNSNPINPITGLDLRIVARSNSK